MTRHICPAWGCDLGKIISTKTLHKTDCEKCKGSGYITQLQYGFRCLDFAGHLSNTDFDEIIIKDKVLYTKSGKPLARGYDGARRFGANGLARVELKSKWGLINEEGLEVVEPKYDDLGVYYDGVHWAVLNFKWGFLNEEGKETVPLRYDAVFWFSEGLAGVNIGGKRNGYDIGENCIGDQKVLGGKWGFVNKEGLEVVPLKYDKVSDFSEGLAGVNIGGKYIKGKYFGEYQGGKWGFVNTEGLEVFPLKYDNVSDFSEGLAGVELNGKWGFIDKRGKEVVPLRYDYVSDFSEGRAAVKLGGKWGFINKEGVLVIPLKYEHAGDFSEGLAIAGHQVLTGKAGFINTKGDEVVPMKYLRVWPYSEGLACVQDYKGFGFVNTKGVEVIPLKYDGVENFKGGLARVGRRGDHNECVLWGFINKEGVEVIPLKYSDLGNFYNGFAEATLNGRTNFIAKSGEWCGRDDPERLSGGSGCLWGVALFTTLLILACSN